MVTFAIETASPRMQKTIRKNLKIEKVTENINHAASLGLLIRGFFMLGFPGETPEEIKQTVDYAVRSKLDLAHFFMVTPHPGTELRKLAEETYPELLDEAALYGFGYWSDKPFYQQVTGYNLNRAQKLAYFRFYFPFRVFKTFYKMPLKTLRLRKWLGFIRRVLLKPLSVPK